MNIRCNQASLKLLKLCVASLCALIACWLPQSLSRPHEAGVAVSHFKPVSALPALKLVSYTELSPVSVPAPAVAPPVPAAPQAVVSNGCGDNQYAHYIYLHESGCRTDAIGSLTNLGRACGIGQALPCAKLPCSLSDYACQNLFFDNYALARYGSWAAAAAYWASHGNW